MALQVICRNENGVQGTFGYDYDPFYLLSLQGATSVFNNVIMSDNTTIDGATYQGSTTKKRNIIMTLQMKCFTRKDAQEYRDFLYKLFKPKATGTFIHTEEEETRVIDYEVESVDIDKSGILRNAVISLLCPDPHFKAPFDIDIDLARWLPMFEFFHEFQLEGEEFGTRVSEIIKEIENDSAAANIGITITFEAVGAVMNPSMYHIESGEFIQAGTAARPFYMNMGDVVIITTETNNKNVTLTRAGETTIINQFLDEGSEFIALSYGLNTLKYDAFSGIDYLNVKISFCERFLGV